MKKLLIGCGILVLLFLGALGFLGYKLYPSAREMYDSIQSSTVAMEELDRRFPYDPQTADSFDQESFAEALAMRTELRGQMHLVSEIIEGAEHEDAGVLDSMAQVFSALSDAIDRLIVTLNSGSMGPTEFSHHMLTYWAAASSAAAGGGDASELASLIKEFETFKVLYSKKRDMREDMLPLEQRLSEVDEALTAGARAYLATVPPSEPVSDEELAFDVELLQLTDPTIFMSSSDGAVQVQVDTR